MTERESIDRFRLNLIYWSARGRNDMTATELARRIALNEQAENEKAVMRDLRK